MGLIGSKLNPPNRKLISSPDQLLEDIITCNIVSQKLKDNQGCFLQVDILQDDQSSILIEKKLPNSAKNTWILNLRQFYIFFRKISQYLEDIKEDDYQTPTETTEDEDDCVICLERQSEVMLLCTHRFCSICLKKWTSIEKCCPVCRQHADADDKDELWHLLDNPSKEELHNDIIKLLDELVGASIE